MNSKNKYIIVVILAILIALINTFTIARMLKDGENITVRDYNTVFDVPDTIVISEGTGAKIVFDGRNEFVYDVIELNRTREDTLVCFTEMLIPVQYNGDELCIEYIFNESRDVALTFSLEKRVVSADSIKFVLTGAGNGTVVIKSGNAELIIGTLNPSAELIEVARGLLK